MKLRRLGAGAAAVLLALLPIGLTLTPTPAAAAWFRAPAAQRLTPVHGDYVLGRAFEDYYDSAFVLTQDGRGGPRVLELAELADALLPYDVIFYGESHGHPGVHLQQMRLLRALYQRDRRLVLSFEQFERDTQSIVDAYLAGRIGETTLIDEARAWDNYAASYRPLLTFAKVHRLPVIAAEAPGWEIGCIGQWGTQILDQFTPAERSWMARDLHITAGAYRDKFMEFQNGSVTHGGGGEPTEQARAQAARSFAAQVARDDTMAESIERALQRYPGHKVLHLTGDFHVAGFLGTVERLRLRAPTLRIAVIATLEVDDPDKPAFAAERLGDGTVLQLIYPNPESFADGEDMSAWALRMRNKRAANSCRYTPPGAG